MSIQPNSQFDSPSFAHTDAHEGRSAELSIVNAQRVESQSAPWVGLDSANTQHTGSAISSGQGNPASARRLWWLQASGECCDLV